MYAYETEDSVEMAQGNQNTQKGGSYISQNGKEMDFITPNRLDFSCHGLGWLWS